MDGLVMEGSEENAIPILHFIDYTIPIRNFFLAPEKKTGPEAGQYFHVRPPIGFI